MIREGIVKAKLAVPEEKLPVLRDGFDDIDVVTELDLKSANVTNVIWATSYKFDFSLVKLPIQDGHALGGVQSPLGGIREAALLGDCNEITQMTIVATHTFKACLYHTKYLLITVKQTHRINNTE